LKEKNANKVAFRIQKYFRHLRTLVSVSNFPTPKIVVSVSVSDFANTENCGVGVRFSDTKNSGVGFSVRFSRTKPSGVGVGVPIPKKVVSVSHFSDTKPIVVSVSDFSDTRNSGVGAGVGKTDNIINVSVGVGVPIPKKVVVSVSDFLTPKKLMVSVSDFPTPKKMVCRYHIFRHQKYWCRFQIFPTPEIVVSEKPTI
jgi:hypothetical protein